MNSDIVGQSAETIATRAGINVPVGTRLLVAPLEGVGDAYPLSSEVLAPILAYYVAPDFEAAVSLCLDLNYHGGVGHTASIFSNDDERIRKFALMMNAGRVVVNTPSSQGAVGGMFNRLEPSFTLGCGTGGKNITTENVTARHLLNIQRITKRRLNERFGRMSASRYLDDQLDAVQAEKEFNRNY
jgi:acetaldehyde dehydrogenase/alcohol dehydrogenase